MKLILNQENRSFGVFIICKKHTGMKAIKFEGKIILTSSAADLGANDDVRGGGNIAGA